MGEYEIIIFNVSLIYLIIVAVVGMNYLLSLLFLKKNNLSTQAKLFGVASITGLGFLLGIVPFALVGTYVLAAVQTRKQIKHIENQILGKGDKNDDDG